MEDIFRSQLYKNIKNQSTEVLIEIWEKQDHEEWQDITFEIVKEILLNRLGSLPQKSIEVQVEELIKKTTQYIDKEDYQKALNVCEQAILLSPDNAEAFYYRGMLYDLLDNLELAMIDYQKAVLLDPEYKDAWDDMISLEKELEELFEQTSIKQALDRALDFAQDEDMESALVEIEQIKQDMPNLAIAWNYRGMIFENLGLFEQAIESFLEAVRINPRFWNARENLGNARYKMMEEMYRHPPEEFYDEESGETILIPDCGNERLLGPLNIEETLPGWFYKSERTYIERGFPGHRSMPHRSGYDPLDQAAEQGRMEGIIIRKLFTGKMRTCNPFFRLLMYLFANFLCLPIPAILFVPMNFSVRMCLVTVLSPFIAVGLACFVNLIRSIVTQPSEEDREWDRTFY